MMHNPNLMYAIYPIVAKEQDVMETFFVNALWKDHKVCQGSRDACYIIDGDRQFCIAKNKTSRLRKVSDTIGVSYDSDNSDKSQIPLWMFGFLY